MNVLRKFLRDGGAQKPECLHCHFSAIHDGGSAGGFLLKSSPLF